MREAKVRAWPLLAATAAAVIAAAPATAQPAAQAGSYVRRTITQDPAIRSGVLPNGLRYYIRSVAQPQHSLSLRLGFDVGSIEESDSERGFAHLVEHLAFRKTKSSPEGDMDAQFARMGVAFGRDQLGDVALDPRRDAARIRAFFIHPEWARRGVGTLLLKACEDAAAEGRLTECKKRCLP